MADILEAMSSRLIWETETLNGQLKKKNEKKEEKRKEAEERGGEEKEKEVKRKTGKG